MCAGPCDPAVRHTTHGAALMRALLGSTLRKPPCPVSRQARSEGPCACVGVRVRVASRAPV
jgi:hypothetical protein